MSTNQIAAIVLAVLALGAGAAGAATVSGPLHVDDAAQQQLGDEVEVDGDINVSVAGNVTPGETVTLTATLHGEPVHHAPVEVNGEPVGETAADGTIDVTVPDDDEFEVEIEPDFEGETTVQLSEEADDEKETDDDELQVEVSGNVTPGGTVTVTATQDGSPVENATVTVGDEEAGSTGADGSLDVTLPTDADEVEIEVESDDREGEWEHEFEEEQEEAEDDEDDERSIDLGIDGNVTPNETVTVVATVDGTPLANADVKINGETVGTTDDDGTLQVTVPEDADEFEVEAKFDRKGKLKVEFEDEEADEEADEELQIDVAGDVTPGGDVTVTATQDGSPVENATVTVNGEAVGTTGADGALDVTLPADADEVEIEVESEDREGEWEEEFENEDEEDDDAEEEDTEDAEEDEESE